MSAFVVVEKLSLKKEQIEGEILVLEQASIIHTKLNRDDVAEFIQEGQHLILKLKNGEVIIIENFFTQFEQDLVSDLVFEDDECAFLWFDWNNGVPVFKELAGLEALLPIASNTGSIAPLILGGAALVGGGIAIAENRDNNKSPAKPGNTPPQVEVIIDKDGTITIKYPDNVDPESISPDDIIIKDKNGNHIDVEFEKGDDNTLTGKVPEDIQDDITVTVPEGSYTDKEGNPGGEGSDHSPVDTKAPTVDVEIDEKGNITIKFPDADFDPSTFDPKTDVVITGKDGKPVLDKDGNPIKVDFTPGKNNTWTAKVPEGMEKEITVTVPDGSYADKSGNTGSEGADTELVDTRTPNVYVNIDEKGNISIEFSPDVDPKSIETDKFIILDQWGNEVVIDLEISDDGLSFSGSVPKDYEGKLTVSVPADAYTGLGGEPGHEDSDSALINTKAPTVQVDIDDDNKNVVTFIFSEVPYGADGQPLTADELKALIKSENAQIDFDNLTTTDGGLTWTAPIQAEHEGEMKIEIPSNSYADKAGNLGQSGSDTETVKPPKVEQETELTTPKISGGTDLEGNDSGNHFESRKEDASSGKGDASVYTEHKLKFIIDKGQDLSSIRSVINLDKLDNSFMIWVNGEKIADTGVFQVQDNDDTHTDQINLVFRNENGEDTWLSDGKPWLPNENGLPRFQIVITEKGVRFYATRDVKSTELEEIFFQNEDDKEKFNKIVFKDGVNEIIVGSADGTGTDAIKGYLTVTVGGQFVISDEDSANIESMTITLTGAQIGDELIPVLPLGIKAELFKEGDVWKLLLSGEASKQDYQDALNALMFKGTKDGERNISIKVKDSSGLESEIANGFIDYKVSEGTITIGQFDYSVSKVAALSGDDDISTGDTGHDALIYEVLDAADAKAGHGVDTWTDFHLGAMADDANADVIQFTQDFFKGLLDDQSNISKFISVDYDAATQQAIISIDRDGQGVVYGQEKFLVLDNQTQDFDLQKLLENQQIIIG